MYYYLDISFVNQDITAALFKNHIITSIKHVFGEIAAAIPFDVVKYDPSEIRAIVRVTQDHYVKFRGSLTLAGYYQGKPCAYIVHKVSPLLLSLLGDSRTYVH
ncbi:hypothetical protein RI129_004030 [Pyrocoelia pectoralis]|uniref:Uncharacterized protein n=1 Tax=Pyrocoelia pectoralis TaxID=417401 RepID=A0AAN7VTK9_9COLE